MTQQTVLKINSSGRYGTSVSRQLTDDLVAVLQKRGLVENVVERDVAEGLPFVSEQWIAANFTPEADRTPEQRKTLQISDFLVQELLDADTVVIGLPIYNFGIPAALKAWVDMIARAGKTFKYSEKGPVGLIDDKKVYLVVTSGGTAIGSEIDFASSYMRHVLGFVGLPDVTVIDAAQARVRGAEAVLEAAQSQIESVRLALAS